MKQKVIILAILLAAGATLVVLNPQLHSGEQRSEEPEELARDNGRDRVTPATGLRGPAESGVSADPEAHAARVDELISRGYIPAEYRDLWLDPNYEEIAEEQFNVIPKIARDPGETCEPLGVEESHLCWNDYGYHPYLAYELEQLKSMAETDAVAAEAVAMRLPRDRLEERLYYSLQASRLSGKSGPVMRFVYTSVPGKQDPAYFERMLDTYSLARLGERLGYPYRYSVELEAIMMKEFDLSRDELYKSVDERRKALLEKREEAS